MQFHIDPYVAVIAIICGLAAFGLNRNRTFRIRARGFSIESEREEKRLEGESNEAR